MLERLRSAYSRATSSLLYSSFSGEDEAGYTAAESPRRHKVGSCEFGGGDMAVINLGRAHHIGAPSCRGGSKHFAINYLYCEPKLV